jgi:hypothetical protein
MDKMLIAIMEQMDCTESDAKTILNTVLNKNTFQRLVLNTVKKEYDLR